VSSYPDSPKSINDIIRARSRTLSSLYEHVASILSCQGKLRSELGLPLAEHLVVADISRETLTLHTDSPAWASRLRYNIQNILKIARCNCDPGGFKSVRIKVVIRDTDDTPKRQISHPSEHTITLIDQTARSIKDHNLRASLLSLARHRLAS
jgi:hypothetical protein